MRDGLSIVRRFEEGDENTDARVWEEEGEWGREDWHQFKRELVTFTSISQLNKEEEKEKEKQKG